MECYICVWIVLEACAAIIACIPPVQPWLAILLRVVVVLRILEILQVTVNVCVFDALSDRPDQIVGSRARMIVLGALNFLELCACFRTIYALAYTNLHGAGKPVTAFYYSVITQATIGYGDVDPVHGLRIVAAIQALVGVLFVLLVLSRFVASLKPMRALFDDE